MTLSVLGALLAVALLAGAFVRQPDLTVEMDRELPRLTASGFYSPERAGEDTFAWTARSAVLRLPGLDRRVDWRCAARVRAGRSADLETPTVDLAVDGLTLASEKVTNEYRVLEATAPAQPSRSGLNVTITSSPTFVPGPGDARTLGVQVDRVACAPVSSLVLPPRGALGAAAMSGAVFGAAFGLIGLSLAGGISALLVLAAMQAVALSSGLAPFGPYADAVAPLAFWIAAASVLAAAAMTRLRGQPLHAAARFVIAFSAAALFIELLALLHPLKQIVDALFHAHRLQWVLAGRYFFTQPMPSGVQFPYAIGLYVFAAPWSALTQDHVWLLRVVVSTAHTIAAASLYPLVVRGWGSRVAGAVAVVLYHLVPLPYAVIGNANLTYAFGQSVAVVVMSAAATWSLRGRDVPQLAALFLLAALAFLSHVGVFPTLMASLTALAVLYWFRGGPALRSPSRSVFGVAVLAAVVSVVAYYGQFGEAYETLNRVRARATGAAAQDVGRAGEDAAPTPRPSEAPVPRPERAVTALRLGVQDAGWAVLMLAVIGAWSAREKFGDRLGLALAAWGLAYAAFLVFSVAVPVEPRFQRYTDEFVSRVNYATIPAVVVLAATGAAWGWKAGMAGRLAVAVLGFASAVVGVIRWYSWLQ